MPINTIRKVADLVPEVHGMIKQATLEGNYLTDTREHAIVSALEIEYMTKIAHTPVSLEDGERVAKAVDLYDAAGIVRDHAVSMIKSARAGHMSKSASEELVEAENIIISHLHTARPNLEKVAEASERLYDNNPDAIENESVRLYAGAGTLVKQAAVDALTWRAKRTGNEEFTKIASVIANTDPAKLTVEDNRAITSAVRSLEKAASYMESDFYKDAFMTKQAAVMVKLASKEVPSESLISIAETAGSVLGSDIGQLLKEAAQNKHAIEALPLGELQAIEGMGA